MKSPSLMLLAALALFLAGCAGDSDKQAYLNAQISALEKQKPLWELEAQEGQNIELKGVKKIAVYAQGGGAGQIRALSSDWAPVVREGLGLLGMVGGIYFGGEQAVKLVEAVGKSAGAQISGSFNASGSQSTAGFVSGAGGVSNSASSTEISATASGSQSALAVNTGAGSQSLGLSPSSEQSGTSVSGSQP